MVVLQSSDDTTKEEATGLAAYSNFILQISEDLQGYTVGQYDQDFCEWAAII